MSHPTESRDPQTFLKLKCSLRKGRHVKWSDIINYTASEFKNTLNRNILATLTVRQLTDNYHPLDRIIGSYDEVADTERPQTKAMSMVLIGMLEQLDRCVSHAISCTETTGHYAWIIDDVIAACEPYWDSDKNKVILTWFMIPPQGLHSLRGQEVTN